MNKDPFDSHAIRPVGGSDLTDAVEDLLETLRKALPRNPHAATGDIANATILNLNDPEAGNARARIYTQNT
jgi:hypothetical protein